MDGPIYNAFGNPLGFYNGDIIYGLDGHAVAQLRGTHVYTMGGHYVAELDDDMVLDKNLSLGSIGARGAGSRGARGMGSRGARGTSYPDASIKIFGKQ
jgi:hypothetical protein